jgi:excisionase family DNA binding protein
MPSEPILMTVKEAIAYLRLSESTLVRMRRSKTGPAFITIRNRVMYSKQDLDAYLNQNRTTTETDQGV